MKKANMVDLKIQRFANEAEAYADKYIKKFFPEPELSKLRDVLIAAFYAGGSAINRINADAMPQLIKEVLKEVSEESKR